MKKRKSLKKLSANLKYSFRINNLQIIKEILNSSNVNKNVKN